MRRTLSRYSSDQLEKGFKYTGGRKFLKPLRTTQHGVGILHDPLWNKGTAFNFYERDRLGLRGLLPPCERSIDQQKERVLKHLENLEGNVAKNLYLQDLQNRNETLYFRTLVDHIEEMAPLVYTPTVGVVCQKFGNQYTRARGMYFSKYDRGYFSSMVHNWPHEDVHVIVVTDGSRILGLGDLGVNGMGIPIGKLALYCAAGGIAPHRVLPICLDVGTNNEDLLKDPEYMGIREHRVVGDEYFDMVDELMHAINSRWPTCIVQFEDFETPKAVPLLDRYRNRYRMFNDDIQGTGVVTLAGVLSAVKISGQELKDVRVLCAGAGSAGLGVCQQLMDGMIEQGLSRKEAQARFALLTNLGVIGNPDSKYGNPNHKGGCNGMHVPWINVSLSDGMSLLEAVKEFKPNVLLGLSTAPGIFNEEVIRAMSAINERPIILPMSNPTARSECTPEQAYRWSNGKAIVATGSPFDPVTLDGKTYVPSQSNNMFVFPGIGLAASVSGVTRITDRMLYLSAIAISESMNADEVAEGRTFPHIKRIRDVTQAVAKAIILEGRRAGLLLPSKIRDVRDEQIPDLIRRKMYVPYYSPLIPMENNV